MFNSGATDQGFLAARRCTNSGRGCSARAGRATSAATSAGRGTTRTTVRFYYPVEDSHRFTSTYDLRQRRRVRARDDQRVRRQLPPGDRPGPLRDRHARAHARGGRLRRGRLPGARPRPSSCCLERAVRDGRRRQRALQRPRHRHGHQLRARRQRGERGRSASRSTRRGRDRHRRVRLRSRPRVSPKATLGGRHPRRLHDQPQQRRLLRRPRRRRTAPLSGSGSLTVGPWAGVSFVGAGRQRVPRSDGLGPLLSRARPAAGYITGNPDLKPERSVPVRPGRALHRRRASASGCSGYQY
ncbi:MAG: hypothetical protein MZV64_42610 [Ignavibacteriales bacterium]|nr:hypothetical protein [Ignavibacteriales bacterium]